MFSIHFRHRLLRSGILKGRTDIHSHILPGVDDGSPDIPNSLDLLDYMEEIGFAHVWLTPHVMADLHQTSAHLQEVFEDFQSRYQGYLKIHLAAEYMMDAAFRDQLHTSPLRLGRNHLLVETSYMSGPMDLQDILLDVWQTGFKPLLAHPERYMYMDEADYQLLHDKGYDFQLNLMSLSGYYGGRPKIVAEKLLEQGFYTYVGSDLHHLDRYEDFLYDLRLTRRQLDQLDILLSNNENV